MNAAPKAKSPPHRAPKRAAKAKSPTRREDRLKDIVKRDDYNTVAWTFRQGWFSQVDVNKAIPFITSVSMAKVFLESFFIDNVPRKIFDKVINKSSTDEETVRVLRKYLDEPIVAAAGNGDFDTLEELVNKATEDELAKALEIVTDRIELKSIKKFEEKKFQEEAFMMWLEDFPHTEEEAYKLYVHVEKERIKKEGGNEELSEIRERWEQYGEEDKQDLVASAAYDVSLRKMWKALPESEKKPYLQKVDDDEYIDVYYPDIKKLEEAESERSRQERENYLNASVLIGEELIRKRGDVEYAPLRAKSPMTKKCDNATTTEGVPVKNVKQEDLVLYEDEFNRTFCFSREEIDDLFSYERTLAKRWSPTKPLYRSTRETFQPVNPYTGLRFTRALLPLGSVLSPSRSVSH
jgi:hypothetical protein